MNGRVTSLVNAILTHQAEALADIDEGTVPMATAAKKVQPANKAGRKRVLIRATVYAPEGPFTVWIRDISNGSAQVTSETRLPVGCDVIVKRGPLFAAASIAKSDASGSVLEFYRDLSADEIESVLTPVIAR